MRTMTRTLEALERSHELLERENAQLRHEARTDALTGLGNRRFLEERTSGRGGWFTAIDLDGFKAAQDAHQLGHRYGDLVLRSMARLLLTTAADGDRVACRVGGDEFIVWSPTRAAALAVQQRVHDWTCGQVRASAGVGPDLQRADSDCYYNKRRRMPLLRRLGL